MIDTDTIERDILVHGRDKVIALLLEEAKRMRTNLKSWAKMLEIVGVRSEKMSAALSFAFADDDGSSFGYLQSILSLDENDIEWFKETHGEEMIPHGWLAELEELS
jgi:hypothetical protein